MRWHDRVSDLKGSRRTLSGDKPEQAMWLKYVDPKEEEGEHFEVYEQRLPPPVCWNSGSLTMKKEEFDARAPDAVRRLHGVARRL